MTSNVTLSIPNALRALSPDDYRLNAAIIDWAERRQRPAACPLGFFRRGIVNKAGRNTAVAKDFVRFLVEDG